MEKIKDLLFTIDQWNEQRIVSERELFAANVDIKRDLLDWMAGFSVRMRARVAELDVEESSAMYPSSMKDCFKHYLPTYLKKWFPVRYNKIYMKRSVLYPTLPIPSSDKAYPIILKREHVFTDYGEV